MAPIFTGNKFGFGRGAAAAAPTPFSATGGNQNGITPGNGYTYHTFTSPGTLICAGDENKLCELFLVGAGGRGGSLVGIEGISRIISTVDGKFAKELKTAFDKGINEYAKN